jgi:hypothetical protein
MGAAEQVALHLRIGQLVAFDHQIGGRRFSLGSDCSGYSSFHLSSIVLENSGWVGEGRRLKNGAHRPQIGIQPAHHDA